MTPARIFNEQIKPGVTYHGVAIGLAIMSAGAMVPA
jgi:hypothetical protein